MLGIIISILTFSAVLVAYGSTRSSIHKSGEKLLKPPNTLPLLGNAIIFLEARHKLFHWFAECQRQYGFQTLEISVPTLPSGVVISDPENLEFVLKHDEVFTKGDFFKSRSWDLFGNGIINVDGPLWKAQRKAALRFFSSTSLKTLVDVHVPVFVNETRSQLSKAVAEGKSVDLEAVFMDFTTRLMGRLAYDIDMQSSTTFFKSFDLASGAITERFQNPFWRITERLLNVKLRRALSEVQEFGASIVATTLKKREYHLLHGQPSVPKRDVNPEVPTPQSDGYLINALIDNFDDPRLIADSALNFLSAGRDTTAQALTWTFYLLTRHPTTISMILTELSHLNSLNSTKTLNLTSQTLTPTSLPYTHAVFYESLRLYPPIPFEIKQCSTATTLPDRTSLPKESVVVWCPWAMGRSRKIWGDDAEVFRPERWLEDIEDDDAAEGKVRFVPRSAYEFPVFNAGPRACMGKKMAELQAVYMIASLVWDFEFEEIGEMELNRGEGNTKRRLKERISRNSLTLPMDGGLPCFVKRRRAR